MTPPRYEIWPTPRRVEIAKGIMAASGGSHNIAGASATFTLGSELVPTVMLEAEALDRDLEPYIESTGTRDELDRDLEGGTMDRDLEDQ